MSQVLVIAIMPPPGVTINQWIDKTTRINYQVHNIPELVNVLQNAINQLTHIAIKAKQQELAHERKKREIPPSPIQALNSELEALQARASGTTNVPALAVVPTVLPPVLPLGYPPETHQVIAVQRETVDPEELNGADDDDDDSDSEVQVTGVI